MSGVLKTQNTNCTNMHKQNTKHKLIVKTRMFWSWCFNKFVFYLGFVSLDFVLLGFSKLALAQGLPPGQPITLDVLDYIIFRVSTFFISVSGVLALIFIIWAGVTYMYAGEDTTKVQAAQGRLRSGIIGAAIILGVGVIIQTIASVVTLDFFCTLRVPVVGICIY